MYGELNQRVYLPRLCSGTARASAAAAAASTSSAGHLSFGLPIARFGGGVSARGGGFSLSCLPLGHLLAVCCEINALKESLHRGMASSEAKGAETASRSNWQINSILAWLNSCTNWKLIPFYRLVDQSVLVRYKRLEPQAAAGAAP